MPQKTNLFLLILIVIGSFSFAQKKSLEAKLSSDNITVDGKLDEEIWKTTPIASGFIMYQPDNGKPIPENKKTEVQIVYNNDAIYVAAKLYDDDPNKISKEITPRDTFGNSDLFGVFINGNNDGQQDYQFIVTASGVQIDDSSNDKNPDDYTWDAVWDSSVKITDFGWVVEMKIPYATLRFTSSKKQIWGINFYRDIKRENKQYTWNHIDTHIESFHQQYGILEGIENITTPTRLFLIPYSSYYYENNQLGSNNKLKAGLDIKYGISDAFTLDAILVPDFGQTKFDNTILNLTPFEQVYNENRPFFTEGTDLFNKGNLFYSRRIGQASKNHPTLDSNETVTIYPSSVDLLNALKISGRTKGGLGIGVLNAVTQRTYETTFNSLTNETKKVEIEPLANYNILVLDQRFHKNSSISFVNTNVTRSGNFRDANVSAIISDLNTKKNTYNFYTDFKYSTVHDGTYHNGFKTGYSISKTSGKYRFYNIFRYLSKDYDINDLGIIYSVNYYGTQDEISYRIINPTKKFNSFVTKLNANFNFQNNTGKLQDGLLDYSIFSTLKKNSQLNFDFTYSPFETFGFYQLRAFNRFSFTPQFVGSSIEYISNPNHSFWVDIKPYATKYNQNRRISFGAVISPTYRINDKFSLNYLFSIDNQLNDIGLVDYDSSGFYYAKRNNKTIDNELAIKYSLNNKMTLNLITRYYWSFSENNSLFSLRNDGHFSNYSDDPALTNSYNQNFNSWNLDLSYSWWFAPASQISILYRNKAIDDRTTIDKKLGNNLHDLFQTNLDNIFSVSIRYYVDYNVIKNKF